jgi:ATP-dependent Clp protease ATP-binding subunit ClpA
MFERYNEKARRTIFFARYEASQFGTPEIETEHLLLGILREGRSALNLILGLQNREDEIRAAVVASTPQGPKTSTSVDLPLTNECKRILAYGAEEASKLGAKHIGVEHLMLGILREEKCLAALILRERGVQLKKARTLISEAKEELTTSSGADVSEKAKAAATNLAVAIQIVDAGSSETLLAYQGISLIPRIGESVFIRDEQSLGHSHRVQDVAWEFETIYGCSTLKGVKVSVVKEKAE